MNLKDKLKSNHFAVGLNKENGKLVIYSIRPKNQIYTCIEVGTNKLINVQSLDLVPINLSFDTMTDFNNAISSLNIVLDKPNHEVKRSYSF